jgi:4-hydroxy-4-methyl-2-oxoglutarate aldolase
MEADSEQVRAIASRFRKCNTATIYDVMDRMGYPHQCIDLGIKPIDLQMRIAGPAFTVRGTREPRYGNDFPRPQFDNFGLFKAMTPGCIVVINAEQDQLVGHWGEMMSLSARQFGATGAVIDGGTRDRDGLLKIPDWGVFARYTSPIESKGRWRSQEFGVPIFLSGTTTSSVLVRPGDYIVGDSDGVMVIPLELVESVLEETERTEVLEEGTRRDLAAGLPIWEVYERYQRM